MHLLCGAQGVEALVHDNGLQKSVCARSRDCKKVKQRLQMESCETQLATKQGTDFVTWRDFTLLLGVFRPTSTLYS